MHSKALKACAKACAIVGNGSSWRSSRIESHEHKETIKIEKFLCEKKHRIVVARWDCQCM